MPTLIYKSKDKSVKVHWTLEEGDDSTKRFAVCLSELLASIDIDGLTYLVAYVFTFLPSDQEICGKDVKNAEAALFDAANRLVLTWDDWIEETLRDRQLPDAP